MTIILSSIRFSRQGFFQIQRSWRLRIQEWVLMHGEVYSLGGTLFRGERAGGLAMEKKSKFGKIIGCQGSTLPFYKFVQ